MTHDRMKAIKIVDEMISFYLKYGITNLHIDFQYEEGETIIQLQGQCENLPIEELEELKELLNAPRQPELEEYYWELVGGNENYQELTLLGALVDSGDVSYSDNQLKIRVLRKR